MPYMGYPVQRMKRLRDLQQPQQPPAFKRGSIPASYSSDRSPGGGTDTTYVPANPFAGMGYNGPIGGLNAPLYGGAATSIPVGTIPNFARINQINQLNAQLAQQYQQAYSQAREANQNRYNELVGNSAGLGLPVGMLKGQRVVQINGRWVPASEVDESQLNSEVAQNSLTAPALGGYYGRYARGMTGADALGSVADAYDQRTSRNLGYVDNMGQQERKDISERSEAELGARLTDLQRRGLTNSTVAATIRQGAEREKNNALGRLNDRLLETRLRTDMAASGDALSYRDSLGRLRLATDAGLSKDLLDFGERRTDAYPDMSTYLQLMSQLGRYS